MRSLPHLAFGHRSRDVKQYLAQPFSSSSPTSHRAQNARAYQILPDTLRTQSKFQHGPLLRLWVHPAGVAGRNRFVRLQFGDSGFCAEKMAELGHAAA